MDDRRLRIADFSTVIETVAGRRVICRVIPGETPHDLCTVELASEDFGVLAYAENISPADIIATRERLMIEACVALENMLVKRRMKRQ